MAINLAVLLVVPSAWAESPPGFYAGGGVGSSNITVEGSSDNFLPAYIEGPDDTAYEVHAGYRVTRHFGAELGYFNAGPEWTSLLYVPQTDELYGNSAYLDLQAVQIGVVGILPFGRLWEAYVRGGAAYWQTDADQTLLRLSDGAVTTRSLDASGTNMLLALGVGASPSPALHLRVEFQSFEIDRDLVSVDDPTTIDTMLFQVEFHFGARARALAE